MPIKCAVETDFILSLQIFVDDRIFEKIFAVCDEEVPQEDGEGSNEKQNILRYDCAVENVDGQVADIG
jgi:hypothetical protein